MSMFTTWRYLLEALLPIPLWQDVGKDLQRR